jgi:low affinity Fe/Cu permease
MFTSDNKISMKKIASLERFSTTITHFAGTSQSFISACLIIVIWLITGPIFDYSDTWQLVINTGTTIITFIMVFLIQRSQNKESVAIQMKLNELVASSKYASNRLIDVEDLNEEELKLLHQFYQELAKMSKQEKSMHVSHTIEEARELHSLKKRAFEEK